MQQKVLIVFTTVSTLDEAEDLAERLVESRFAACVQILPSMTSVYHWEGNIQKETEHLLLIKSLSEKWDELRDFITENHSYSVPEIVTVSADEVAEPYLNWLNKATNE